MTENENIWAPWRIGYIRSLKEPHGCFLCDHAGAPERDAENLVLWRGRACFALLNRYPYIGGHTLVAPYEHLGALEDLGDEIMLEMMQMIRDVRGVLAEVMTPEGFNVGVNLGRCAGAGLPGHLHAHVVPRWSGDTNFMPVFAGVHVVPQALEDLREELRAAAEATGPETFADSS